MKFHSKCLGCNKVKWFIRKRKYRIKVGGLITSQNELCNSCHKGIKLKIKDQLI
jgi:hypothetical protein